MSLPRIIFAGTPDFSVACLDVLLEQALDIVGVYTQPDRHAGRGKKVQQSPVKKRALDAGLTIYQPENFKATETQEELSGLHADLMVVVAYGLILPQPILDAPRLGCINIHASLLPRWRGAAPIQRAIEAGDSCSGVCLMQMERGLDTGPVLARISHVIQPDETGGQLHDTLATMGAQLLQNNLSDILKQHLSPIEQAKQGIRYAHKLSKAETEVQWQTSAIEISNKIRAFNPWPVMFASVNGQRIRFYCAGAEPDESASTFMPGEIIHASAEGIRVATGEGIVNITRVQKPGGKVLAVRDFLNGFPLKIGQLFK